MRNRFLLIVMTCALLVGCSSENKSSEISPPDNVAAESATAPVKEIDTSNLTPVYGTDIRDGEYEISVDSSSSMFNIESCKLTVLNGEMTAEMTMGGTGYLYVFMGKGADAEEKGYIPYKENADGKHTFTVPVKSLDTVTECAAFSKNKEKWYDRTLIFHASDLPLEAFNEGKIITAETLRLADGDYTVDVKLEGGSGKASVETPTKMTVKDGTAYAEIIWSSSSYDYMRVDDSKFEPINTEGNSVFEIPVKCFDFKMAVKADTTAMSTPHEIDYTLFFDSSSISK